MKQISLATTGFELVTKRTRKREFLDEMNLEWIEKPLNLAKKGGKSSFFHVIFKMMSRRMTGIV
jgi:hypothetical protein